MGESTVGVKCPSVVVVQAVTLGSGEEGNLRISSPKPGGHGDRALWPVASATRVRGAVAGPIRAVWDGVAWVGCWGVAIREVN